MKKVIDNWFKKGSIEKIATVIWYGLCVSLVMIATIIGLIDWVNIFGLGHIWWNARFFNHFFVDGDNKFNWIGLTSVLAVISLTFTAWDSRRKLRADLVSKSRIKWMDSLKDSLSSYCSYQQDRLAALNLIYTYTEQGKMKINKLDGNLRDTYTGLLDRTNNAGVSSMKYNWLLVLSLHRTEYGDNSRKKRILELMDETEEKLKEIQKAQNNDNLVSLEQKNFNDVRELLKKINEFTAEYLKEEWERAKRGE